MSDTTQTATTGTTTPANPIQDILTANAATIRKTQFCQQVRMAQSAPAQIAAMQQRNAQVVAQLKARIAVPDVIADLGTDHAAIAAAVAAL